MAGLDVPLLIFGNIDDNKPTVIINARIHPGESNSSWVMQGIIEFFTNVSNKIGLKILNSINLILVPMLNPDGVVAGNYRTSIWFKYTNFLYTTKFLFTAIIVNFKAFSHSPCPAQY